MPTLFLNKLLEARHPYHGICRMGGELTQQHGAPKAGHSCSHPSPGRIRKPVRTQFLQTQLLPSQTPQDREEPSPDCPFWNSHLSASMSRRSHLCLVLGLTYGEGLVSLHTTAPFCFLQRDAGASAGDQRLIKNKSNGRHSRSPVKETG